MFTIGLVGARGYVGQELLALVEKHPQLRVEFVASRSAAGQQLGSVTLEDIPPGKIAARVADVYVLALSNGEAAPYVAAISSAHPGAIIVDVSSDHRAHPDWRYGLPEHNRAALRGARRIANPGCYATAAQLALRPLLPLLDGAPSVFGISGYSGAGATPSPRNDPEALRDNVMPYSLVGHSHEAEISAQLGRRVFFMPHVAPFFRGLLVTASCRLQRATSAGALLELFQDAYKDEPLLAVQSAPPLPRDRVGQRGATIGGFSVDGNHAVVCATLDNLLKGAASQVLQNVNLGLGLPELMGLQ